jgi:hypothetical protein
MNRHRCHNGGFVQSGVLGLPGGAVPAGYLERAAGIELPVVFKESGRGAVQPVTERNPLLAIPSGNVLGDDITCDSEGPADDNDFRRRGPSRRGPIQSLKSHNYPVPEMHGLQASRRDTALPIWY